MKNFLLLLLVVIINLPADARIRLTELDVVEEKVVIKNVAGFAYDYSNFMMSINGLSYNLSTLNIEGGKDMNLDTDESITITGITFPLGASMAIWYNGVDPENNPMVVDLVDYVQYGSAGNEHEQLAQDANYWTVGEYISGIPPYIRTGGAWDEGVGYWTNSGVVGLTQISNQEISVYPNPFTTELTIENPSIDGSITIEILDLLGKIVLIENQIKGVRAINTVELPNGIYVIRLSSADNQKVSTLRMMKSD